MKTLRRYLISLLFVAFCACQRCILTIFLWFFIYVLSFFSILLDSIKSVVNYICVTFITYCNTLFPTNFSTLSVLFCGFIRFILNAILIPENALLTVTNFPMYVLSFISILLDSIKSVVNYICVTFITVILYSQQIFQHCCVVLWIYSSYTQRY